jgi:hypothetical protein
MILGFHGASIYWAMTCSEDGYITDVSAVLPDTH